MNKPKGSVYPTTVKRVYKGKTYVPHLLRHTYRQDGKVKQLTFGSLTDLPDELIELIRRRLTKGEPIGGGGGGGGAVAVVRAVAVATTSRSCAVCLAGVLGAVRKIGLDSLLCSTGSRESHVVLVLIAPRLSRVIDHGAEAMCRPDMAPQASAREAIPVRRRGDARRNRRLGGIRSRLSSPRSGDRM